jgi:hypothetical protein
MNRQYYPFDELLADRAASPLNQGSLGSLCTTVDTGFREEKKNFAEHLPQHLNNLTANHNLPQELGSSIAIVNQRHILLYSENDTLRPIFLTMYLSTLPFFLSALVLGVLPSRCQPAKLVQENINGNVSDHQLTQLNLAGTLLMPSEGAQFVNQGGAMGDIQLVYNCPTTFAQTNIGERTLVSPNEL